MKILYVFPHPDDESFGPAPAIAAQKRQGDEVYLLTLTRGEATKQRFRLEVSKAQMGAIRYDEMQDVKEVLDLNDLTVLDLPDDNLKELDPREIETVVKEHIQAVQPDVVVTYASHGVSGFDDHLVAHAVVKRAYCELKDEIDSLKRLALFTVYQEEEADSKFSLSSSDKEEIDCWIECSDADMQKFYDALDCYETYQEVIEASGVKDVTTNRVPFEFFQENFEKPVERLTEKLER